MAKYILGIDAGTTSVRAGLYDTLSKSLKFKCQKKIDIFCPHDGWAEQDANKIFATIESVVKTVVYENKVDPEDILCMSITNQRETTIAWNKTTGEAVYPAINWQCKRTSKEINELDGITKSYLKHITGLIPDAYFSASKMQWLLKNNNQVQQLLEQGNLRMGTMETYLVSRLTNQKVFVTDVTNASRTMLMDLEKCEWDQKCLQIFDINPDLLAKIVCNDEIVGYTQILGVRTPICGLVGDQQSSLFGQACFDKYSAKCTFGTGCFLLANTGNQICYSENLLSTVAYKLKGESTTYALEGSVYNCGSSIELLKDWHIIDDASQTDQICKSVKDSGKVVFVPALNGLGAPYWDMNARGMFLGMTRGTKREHLVRAVVESIAFSCLDVLLEIKKDLGQIKKIRCDGGVSNNDFLMQFQSDISMTNLVLPQDYEKTLMGCIYLGLSGIGMEDKFSIAKQYEVQKEYKPQMEFVDLKRKYTRWKRAVIRCMDWVE